MESVLPMCQTEVVGSSGVQLLGTKSCWEEEEFMGACWEGLGTTVGPGAGQLCHPPSNPVMLRLPPPASP